MRYFLGSFNHLLKLSAVRKVLETLLFLALGSFGTLGPKLSHGTSSKFADVRTHLRKVSKMTLSTNQELPYLMVMGVLFLFSSFWIGLFKDQV